VSEYVGMGIHDALATALKNGEQLRVMAVNHIVHRHGDECPDDHIQVWVRDGKITRAE
jgi:hypothetical protein